MGKVQEADKNAEFRSDILPDCLGSLICGLYLFIYLFGTFCKPKYSTGRNFDRGLFDMKPVCRAKLLAD